MKLFSQYATSSTKKPLYILFKNTHTPKHSLRFLILPMLAYILLVRGFQKYWLENDLRHLYREILKPYYKRIDDTQCSDCRDLKSEIETNVVDDRKSSVARLRMQVNKKDEKKRE